MLWPLIGHAVGLMANTICQPRRERSRQRAPQVDIHAVPDFNTMYELYDPCTLMFFFRNKVRCKAPLMLSLRSSAASVRHACCVSHEC